MGHKQKQAVYTGPIPPDHEAVSSVFFHSLRFIADHHEVSDILKWGARGSVSQERMEEIAIALDVAGEHKEANEKLKQAQEQIQAMGVLLSDLRPFIATALHNCRVMNHQVGIASCEDKLARIDAFISKT